MEQGRCNGDVLACLGETREGFTIGDDPLVYIAGHGACTPTVSMAFDLPIMLHTFLLGLKSRFLDLLVSGFQLLHPHARWVHYLPLSLMAKVVRRVASSSEMLSTCPSGVPVMKHS